MSEFKHCHLFDGSHYVPGQSEHVQKSGTDTADLLFLTAMKSLSITNHTNCDQFDDRLDRYLHIVDSESTQTIDGVKQTTIDINRRCLSSEDEECVTMSSLELSTESEDAFTTGELALHDSPSRYIHHSDECVKHITGASAHDISNGYVRAHVTMPSPEHKVSKCHYVDDTDLTVVACRDPTEVRLRKTNVIAAPDENSVKPPAVTAPARLKAAHMTDSMTVDEWRRFQQASTDSLTSQKLCNYGLALDDSKQVSTGRSGDEIKRRRHKLDRSQLLRSFRMKSSGRRLNSNRQEQALRSKLPPSFRPSATFFYGALRPTKEANRKPKPWAQQPTYLPRTRHATVDCDILKVKQQSDAWTQVSCDVEDFGTQTIREMHDAFTQSSTRRVHRCVGTKATRWSEKSVQCEPKTRSVMCETSYRLVYSPDTWNEIQHS